MTKMVIETDAVLSMACEFTKPLAPHLIKLQSEYAPVEGIDANGEPVVAGDRAVAFALALILLGVNRLEVCVPGYGFKDRVYDALGLVTVGEGRLDRQNAPATDAVN